MLATQKQYVQWQENKDGNETLHQARWLSESNHVPPARIGLIDDKTSAETIAAAIDDAGFEASVASA